MNLKWPLIFLSLQIFSLIPISSETALPPPPITAENWQSHSDILYVRKLVQQIDSSKGMKRSHNFFGSGDGGYDSISDGSITELIITSDGTNDMQKAEYKKLEIRFMTTGGDADDYYLWTFYFDVGRGYNKPVFKYFSHTSNFGGQLEERFYYKLGKLNWAVANRENNEGKQTSIGDLAAFQFKFGDDHLAFSSDGPHFFDAFSAMGWEAFSDLFVFNDKNKEAK